MFEDVISCLPVVRKLGQSGSSPDQHVQVVQGGDGCGEVPLGRVQLLDVPGDLFHHGFALSRLVLYLAYLTEKRSLQDCWTFNHIIIHSNIPLIT